MTGLVFLLGTSGAVAAVLLDEATSALDSHAERDVQRAVLAVGAGRTILAVAHRLSTVIDFDRIIVIKNGQIIEDGAPSELLEQSGYFAQTWRLQRGESLSLHV